MIPPDESASDTTPHEFIDAEIAIDGLETPADEKALTAALDGLPGIRTLTLAGGKLSVEYDPVDISKAQLGDRIAQAGYRVTEVASGPASAVADAVQSEKP